MTPLAGVPPCHKGSSTNDLIRASTTSNTERPQQSRSRVSRSPSLAMSACYTTYIQHSIMFIKKYECTINQELVDAAAYCIVIACLLVSHFIAHFCFLSLCFCTHFMYVFYLLPFGVINDDRRWVDARVHTPVSE